MSMKKINFLVDLETIKKYEDVAKERGCTPSLVYRDALDFYLSSKYAKDSKDELVMIIESLISKKFAKFEKRIFSLFIKLIVTTKISEELSLYTLEKVLGYKLDNEEKKREIENSVITKIKSINPEFIEY